MKIISKSITILIAIFIMIVTSASAFAAPATSNVSLNVRTGPGTSYNVVDTLYTGERVEVTECVSNGWCRIEHTGPDGWVSSRYLTPIAGGSGGGSGGGSSTPSDPDCSFGITIGPSGPSFSLSCGDAPAPVAPVAPPPPTVTQEACLYKGNNFSGSRTCKPVGTVRPTMTASWNDAVSSIKLSGGAKIRVCQGTNFTGLCLVYSSNKAVLNGALNNRVSSYEVFVGSPSAPIPPAPPPVASEVCFYKGNNFTGSRGCAPVGTNRPTISAAWNDTISSLKLTGGAKVKICQGANFTGLCTNITSNKAVLNGALNNKISSYRVYSGGIPIIPVPPAPPAVPVTFSTGPINLQQTYSANLDNGNIGAAGADIWYEAVTTVNKFITPRNGAKLSISGSSNRGYAGCSVASYSNNKISIWSMPVGTYVCVKTNEGRISEFRLNGYTGTTMRLGYTTWAN
ncbi:MAG: SH3 domain-containing protein [Devosiaceae bacterium]|nr:SH3 domain-containing protein [Devosiaceae bacterium]